MPPGARINPIRTVDSDAPPEAQAEIISTRGQLSARGHHDNVAGRLGTSTRIPRDDLIGQSSMYPPRTKVDLSSSAVFLVLCCVLPGGTMHVCR